MYFYVKVGDVKSDIVKVETDILVINSVQSFENIRVKLDSSERILPNPITVVLNNGLTETLNVVWNSEIIDYGKVGTYELLGDLELKDGVLNSKDKCPTTPAGEAVNVDGCPASVNLHINFENNSYKVEDKLVWESRSPALVAVIIAKFEQKDYVLIGQRGSGAADFQGKWNVPCGYLDWDETGHDGICREVYEETGLYLPDILNDEITGITVIDNFMNQPFFVNTDPGENHQNVSLSYGLYFVCDKLPELTNEHCEPNEVSDLKWMELSQIESYDFAFEHNKRIQHFIEKTLMF